MSDPLEDVCNRFGIHYLYKDIWYCLLYEIKEFLCFEAAWRTILQSLCHEKKGWKSPYTLYEQNFSFYNISGSPIKDRVQIFENAMRDSAGLKTKSQEKPENPAHGAVAEDNNEKENRDALRRSRSGRISKGGRKSSIAQSLLKVSAARR